MADDKAVLNKMTLPQLKEKAQELGLSTRGRKADIVARILGEGSAAAAAGGDDDEIEAPQKEAKRGTEEAPSVGIEEPAVKRVTRSSDGTLAKKQEEENKWLTHDSLLILNANMSGSAEIVSFDMDDTLIDTESGRVFAIGRNDWKWLFECIPSKLKALHDQGKKIVIFTNQSGINGKGGYDKTKERAICGKIEDVVQALGFEVQVFVMTTDDVYRKPATAVWDLMVEKFNGGIKPDLNKSIFVGDAAGRPARTNSAGSMVKKDFSCSDRKFAYNVGIAFKTPEQFFLDGPEEAFDWDSADLTKVPKEGELCEGGIESLTSDKQEMIVLVAFPASGKTTFSKKYLVPKGYFHVNRDTLKTPAKCQKAAEDALKKGMSVVVDNTNPSASARQDFIKLAKERKVPVRCFWFTVDEKLAQHLNMFRERITNGESPHVPHIAYNMFKKNFQEPKLEEGFTEIKRINFVANSFASKEAEKSFYQLC